MSGRLRKLQMSVLLAVLAVAPARSEEPASKEEPSRDIVVERLEVTYRFQNDGTGEIVQAARVRVLTQAGRNGYGQVYFPYSSQLETLRVDYFRTVKHDGTRITVDPAQAVDVASPVTQSAPTFSDLKLRGLVASKLEVGDALEYQQTKTIRVPLKPGDFWAIHFPTRNVPVESEVVVLDVPAERALTLKADPAVKYTTEEKPGRTVYRWEVSNPHPKKNESLSEKPPLFAASTLTDWQHVGEWYLGLQTGRTTVTPEIEALATKLTAGKNTSREKVEAIYTYVSESIRYVALEFGIGGFQAHPAAEVLRNGYGDCKDKHGLLTALLEAVSLKAYPVIVHNERGVIEPAVPMPAQFNHVMSVVPIGNELLWLDTTLEVAPPGFLVKSVRAKQALLAERGAVRLITLPATSDVPEEMRLAVTGKVDRSGKLTLENHLTLRGSMEILYRQIFRSGNKDAMSAVVKALGQDQVEGATTEPPKASDPADLSQPFDVRYQLTQPDFFALLEKKKEMQVPHVLLQAGAWKTGLEGSEADRNEAGKTKEKSEKAKDIDLGGRAQVEEVIDLDFDPGYQVGLPLPIHVERSFGSYDSSYAFDQSHLKVRRIVAVKIDKLPADHRQELESFQRLMDRDLDQTLELRRTGEVDLSAQADALTADQLNDAGFRELDKGEFDTARELLEKATVKDPKHNSAWNNLGRAYAALGMPDEAKKAYEKQIEVNPNDEYAYNNLGSLFRTRGQYEQAVSAYKKQIEINPFDRLVYPNLAETYKAMGKWNEAAEAFEKARAILHDNAWLFVRMGDMYLKAGKVDEAHRRFDRALELDGSPITLNEVAYSLAEARVDLDKAQSYAETAVDRVASGLQMTTLSRTPPQYAAALVALGMYLDTLGWVLFQEGQPSEAEPYLRAAFELHDESLVAEHLARVCAARNDPNSALRYYAYASLHQARPEPVSKELEAYIKERFGEPEALKAKLRELNGSFRAGHKLTLPGRSLTWPANAPIKSGTPVTVQVLVDETGAIRDTKVTSGDEPFLAAALADLREMRFAPLSWPNHGLRTVRSVSFLYLLNQNASAWWDFGTESNPPVALIQSASEQRLSSGPVAGAVGAPGVPSHDELSEGRKSPDREADAHFTLGAQLEAKATTESSKDTAKQDFQAALEQYRLAHELKPGNSAYKSAYARLSRKLKHL